MTPDTLRPVLGARVHDEYVNILADAKSHIDRALSASGAYDARVAIRDARAELGRADSRLSSHATPPA